MKHMILSINGNSERPVVRDFVDNGFLAKDGLKNNKTITGIPINNNGLRDKPSRNSPCKNK